MKYTKDQYLESAATYGIPHGPWFRHDETSSALGLENRDGQGVILVINKARGGRRPDWLGTMEVLFALPDTLIERDTLAAENQRLREALASISCMNPSDQTRRHQMAAAIDRARALAEAALKGGA